MKKPKKPKKPPLAFAVTEIDDHTGGIVWARTKKAARIKGAARWGHDDPAYVTCRREPWADRFHGKPLPAWVMAAQGWNFECVGCGHRIDDDLPNWQDRCGADDTFADMLREARRYRGWTPADVVGHQHSAIFCNQQCKDADDAYRAACKRKEAHAIRVFQAMVLKRFPGVTLVTDRDRLRPHAYATSRKRGIVVQQVSVEFEFPGMRYGPASLRWDSPFSSSYRKAEKPFYSCCNGDVEAFEAFAAAMRAQPEGVQA